MSSEQWSERVELEAALAVGKVEWEQLSDAEKEAESVLHDFSCMVHRCMNSANGANEGLYEGSLEILEEMGVGMPAEDREGSRHAVGGAKGYPPEDDLIRMVGKLLSESSTKEYGQGLFFRGYQLVEMGVCAMLPS